MPLPPTLKEAVERARSGDVDGALSLLLDDGEPVPIEGMEQAHAFVFLLLKARGDLDRALRLADVCFEAAATAADRSLWLLRRGLLHLDRDDKMRALVDLNHVLRLDENEDHTEQARRAMARTLDPDPVLPKNNGGRFRS